MIIKEMKIKDYTDILATSSPVPGGGSVSALTAVQGVALNLMVIDLTIGKEKYKEYEEDNLEAKYECIDLYNKLSEGADNDKKAFGKLSEAYKIPKTNPNRKNLIGKASEGATEAPYSIMKLCYEGIIISERLIDKTNKMASSDIGVAALCFESACKSAWLNVKINLPYLTNDNMKKMYEEEGKKILEKCTEIAEKVYSKVEENL